MSVMACTAVGFWENSSYRDMPLVAAWNGTEWKVQSLPNPEASEASELNGISCVSATACMAVGTYWKTSDTDAATLAYFWNGAKWELQSTPNPYRGAYPEGSWLESVSCASSTSCTSVGSYIAVAGGDATLAESWNGAEWSVQTTPGHEGGKEGELTGVSCTSASACTTVGSYWREPGGEAPLAEHWNGSAWAIQETPSLEGTETGEFSAVSCAGATTCVAVGSYEVSKEEFRTFAESYG